MRDACRSDRCRESVGRALACDCVDWIGARTRASPSGCSAISRRPDVRQWCEVARTAAFELTFQPTAARQELDRYRPRPSHAMDLLHEGVRSSDLPRLDRPRFRPAGATRLRRSARHGRFSGVGLACTDERSTKPCDAFPATDSVEADWPRARSRRCAQSLKRRRCLIRKWWPHADSKLARCASAAVLRSD